MVDIKVRLVKFPHVKSNPTYAYFLPQCFIFVHTIMCGRCIMLLVIIICLIITTASPQNSSTYCIIKTIILTTLSESDWVVGREVRSPLSSLLIIISLLIILEFIGWVIRYKWHVLYETDCIAVCSLECCFWLCTLLVSLTKSTNVFHRYYYYNVL